MRIITYPTHQIVLYMGQKIEVPLWVKYIAVLPHEFGNNSSSLIGFSHKPILTKNGIWTIKYGREKVQEEIGIIRNFKPAPNDIYATLSEVLKP